MVKWRPQRHAAVGQTLAHPFIACLQGCVVALCRVEVVEGGHGLGGGKLGLDVAAEAVQFL